ncbi:MAG: hypothetical protein COS09_02415 [Candidatus Nealsonbacteria bacterium CG01_land_8_20_14_3_00_12]|uniref:Aminoglycoside phosphotransferase domain-containing protein n=1 Tax=Candidatus Nealsonbacteria bacterium CG01_land_8_20_14_3_00_12 TaxID=1974697 RepID=A0A2M7EAX5_9BACT|nr:MAG: hypothetical protein COS09_02415 [Candidatus Nealsonbacteria bacterium CG01_land_8_20_14_3_00_12]
MLTKQKFSKSALRKILSGFDLGKLKEIKPLATSGNITHIIKTNRNNYLLRLCPTGPRWRSKEEIAGELELINRLLKNKFPVPRPVAAREGEFIISWKNHFGYLKNFINGSPKLNPYPEEIRKFGELIGRFHNLVKNYKTKNKREHIWALKETREYFQEKKGLILKSDFNNKREFTEKMAKELSLLYFPDDLPSGTIHEDLGKRHVIWQKDEILGIIDFDRSYYGKLVFDLAEACRGWCFINNWREWSNKNFRAFINSYQNERKLAKIEKKYLADAIKFGILERSLSFCLRFIEVTRDSKDEKFAWHSISERGLLGMVNANKKKIEKIMKIA